MCARYALGITAMPGHIAQALLALPQPPIRTAYPTHKCSVVKLFQPEWGMSHKKVLWARRDFALSREGRLSRQARQNIVGEPVPIKLGLGDVPHVGHIGARPHGTPDFIGFRGV
jgi:hypothetical protein